MIFLENTWERSTSSLITKLDISGKKKRNKIVLFLSNVKIILLSIFVLLFYSYSASANSKLEYTDKQRAESVPSEFLSKLDTVFVKDQLTPIYRKNRGKILPFLGVHEVYEAWGKKELILLTYGVAVTGISKYFEAIPNPNGKGFLFYGKNHGDTFEIWMNTDNANWVKSKISALENALNQTTSTSFKNLITPVYAAEKEKCDIYQNQMHTNLQQLESHFKTTQAWEMTKSCIMGAGEGIWDSTGGMVQDLWKQLSSVVKDPFAIYDKIATFYDEFKSFITNISERVQTLAATIGGLDAETKVQIICNLIGSIGTDVLIGLVTGGAAMAKLSLTVNRYLKTIPRILKVAKTIEKLSKIPKISLQAIRSKLFYKIARGKIPETRIKTIETLSDKGYAESSWAAAQCAVGN